MNGPGMWMPTRQDGKNWIVNYTVTLEDGTTHDQHRKFRVRADAYEFISRTKELIADPRTNSASWTYAVEKWSK